MTWHGKTVLITGANGFVGSRLAIRLAEAGAEVRALVRRPGETELLKRPGITEVGGSFLEPSVAMDAVAGAQVVLHVAGGLGKDLDEARLLNRDGTHTMAAAALGAGVERFVQISTGSVYAPTTDPEITEAHPLKTSGDHYGWTKAEADEEVFAFVERGLQATILRPTAILGMHPTSSWGYKAPSRIKIGKFPLIGDGLNTIGWIWIENLVEAVRLSVANDAAVGEAFNLVDGHTTWSHYVETCRSWFPEAPESPRIAVAETPAGTYTKAQFSNAKLRNLLGYAPTLSFDEAMAEAATWWKGQD
jgi:nucleoside-diphosphate-sugar epimerase